MGPRKEALSKTDLQRLIEDYNIIFKGPVPPSEWPIHLRFQNPPDNTRTHRFSVFRKIWSNRYDSLKKKGDLNNPYRGDNHDSVNELREIACNLRKDINTNESTWRHHLEGPVLKIFRQNVICKRSCGKEIHQPKYEAEPLSKDDRDRLRLKRSKRIGCSCGGKAVSFTSEDHEDKAIFYTANEHVISHDDGEATLQKRSIPMKPDTVIGLTTPHRSDLLWNPIKEVQMTCPFMILEAKKESSSPGFRSVERQTAFPIRRLLGIQDCVLKTLPYSHSREPPLVWFFAYQGEEWRLYAGTLESAEKDSERMNVCIYDLWHGNIESQDGALQLLQIIEHIWTWARDIYRPQMRHCLRTMVGRESTPSVPSRIHRSPSAQTEATYYSISDRINSDLECWDRNNSVDQYVDSLQDMIEVDQITPTTSGQYDSHPHPFLRWETLHSTSHLASFATIRHADIVSSSFFLREISDIEIYLSTTESTYTRKERLRLIDMYRFAVLTNRGDLQRLESYWTGSTKSICLSNENVKATLLYHTYLDNKSWQITKEIVCIIWPTGGIDEEALLDRITRPIQTIECAHYQWLVHGILPVKQLQGGRSVLCAFNNYALIPVFQPSQYQGDHSVIWATPEQFFKSDSNVKECIELLQDERLFVARNIPHPNYFDTDTNIAMIGSIDNDVDASEFLPGLPESHENGSLIFVKPNDWPETSPKFCLFVLLKDHFDDAKVLENLLQQNLLSGEILGHGLELTGADKSKFKAWLSWLRTQSPEYEPIELF